MRTICGKEKGVLQMWTSALLGAKKTLGFSQFMVSPQGKGGWARGEGDKFFAILYERPLWTAPYQASAIAR